MTEKKSTEKRDARAKLLFCQNKPFGFWPFSLTLPTSLSLVKGAVSQNSDKVGNYKMPVKLRET